MDSYVKTLWENAPSIDSPIDADNLNHIEDGVYNAHYKADANHNDIVVLNTKKADADDLNTVVKSVTVDDKGVIRVELVNGTVTTYDTALEKIAVNFRYDEATKKLIITLEDGTTQEVDLADLVDDYTFSNSTTINVSKDGSDYSFEVKEGSIEGKHLQPNYLADITAEASKAETASSNADSYAEQARQSANKAQEEAERAELIVGSGIATTEHLGLVKPDGETTFVDENGVISAVGGGGTEAIVLTQAEYNALPDTKLTDGKIYAIKDGKGGGGGGGGSLPSNIALYKNDYSEGTPIPRDADTLEGHPSSYFAKTSDIPKNEYSTEETVVGTWIDGKPLYRKAFVTNISIINGITNIPHQISDIDMVKINSAIYRYKEGATNTLFFTLPRVHSDGAYSIGIEVDNSKILTRARYTYPMAKLEVVLEYTKTTD